MATAAELRERAERAHQLTLFAGRVACLPGPTLRRTRMNIREHDPEAANLAGLVDAGYRKVL